MAINKNNKNFQITLDPDSATILETLAARFNTSKSIIIRNALKVYAAKKSHIIKQTYVTLQEVTQTEQKPSSKNVIEPDWEKQWNNLLKEVEELKNPDDK